MSVNFYEFQAEIFFECQCFPIIFFMMMFYASILLMYSVSYHKFDIITATINKTVDFYGLVKAINIAFPLIPNDDYD